MPRNRFEHEMQVSPEADHVRDDGLKSLIKFVIAGCISLTLLIGFLTALIANWGIWVAASGSLIKFGAQWIIPAFILASVGVCVRYGASTILYYKAAAVDIASKASENAVKQAEAQRVLAEAKRIRDISHLDEQGNLAIRDEITGRWQLVRGNMREHPGLHSMHYSVKSENNGETLALPAGPTTKPKVEDLVKLVERNSFQLPFGNSLRENGVPIVDIDSSHILIIGSSQKGKSCFAAALIDLVTKTHDPDTMVVALLDLENKTSKLFEGMEHLAVLNIGRKEVELHARNPRQVAEYLHYIRNEMDRRYSLPEAEQAQQPHILVYIEEFLSLKKHRDLDPTTRSILLDDLNELAIRGLKVFIHLMACAQVDYADEDLKAFNNNFGINVSFAVKPTAARAAGFVCSELLNANWESKQKGQCVVEATGCTDLVVTPDYDVKALLKARNEQSENASSKPLKRIENGRVVVTQESGFKADLNQFGNQSEQAPQAVLAELDGDQWAIEHFDWKLNQMVALLHETQDEQFRRIWEVSPGPGREYKKAKAERVVLVRHMQSMYRKEA